MRRLACWFLLAQAAGATVWWCLLLARPDFRELFRARGAPDSTLFAFLVTDGVLFIGAAVACAYGLWVGRGWAWPLLCVHAGAAGYAALYSWNLAALTGGDGLLGAVLMTPSLVVPGTLAWLLRPREGAPC